MQLQNSSRCRQDMSKTQTKSIGHLSAGDARFRRPSSDKNDFQSGFSRVRLAKNSLTARVRCKALMKPTYKTHVELFVGDTVSNPRWLMMGFPLQYNVPNGEECITHAVQKLQMLFWKKTYKV